MPNTLKHEPLFAKRTKRGVMAPASTECSVPSDGHANPSHHSDDEAEHTQDRTAATDCVGSRGESSTDPTATGPRRSNRLRRHNVTLANYAFVAEEPITPNSMTQPEGFIDPDHPDWVCRLHKSLYGLKQAPLEWFKMIDTHLCTNGFDPSDADLCIYIQHYKGLCSYIALYVDDCTIIAHCCQIHEIKDMVKAKFPTKDLGEAKSVLGFEIHCDWKNG
jgi:hypothetical protein